MSNVPNTDNFSLQDVINVVGGVSLSTAFANSIDSYFDPIYKGSKDRLSNFRNYGQTGFNLVNTSILGDESITGIELSSNGSYLYLLYGAGYIRLYTLSSPFNVSTRSSTYQQLNTPVVGSLFLVPDETKIIICTRAGHRIYSMNFSSSNNLSTYTGTTGYDYPLIYPSSMSFDPSGYTMTASGYGVGSQISNITVTTHCNTPFNITAEYEGEYGLSTLKDFPPIGFEFNSDGSKYYQVFQDRLVFPYQNLVCTLSSFAISNYIPDSTNILKVDTYVLTKPSVNAIIADFCLSKGKGEVYILWFDISNIRITTIQQYSL